MIGGRGAFVCVQQTCTCVRRPHPSCTTTTTTTVCQAINHPLTADDEDDGHQDVRPLRPAQPVGLIDIDIGAKKGVKPLGASMEVHSHTYVCIRRTTRRMNECVPRHQPHGQEVDRQQCQGDGGHGRA